MDLNSEKFLLKSSTFLKAEWRKLIMINYEVDKEILLKYLPYKTELDDWNHKYYISLVGFMFLNTKVRGIYFPFHKNFEEVNLRFYVRYKDNSEWKRGVVFVKEIVPKPLISFVANTLYNENYVSLPMKYHWENTGRTQKVEYYWKLKESWNHIKVVASTKEERIGEGSEGEFITEHFWGYTKINSLKTSEYEVAHPRWNIYKVNSFEVNCNVELLYGKEFVPYFQRKPLSVFLAEGSAIEVRTGRLIY